MNIKALFTGVTLAAVMLLGTDTPSKGARDNYDVFVPIAKYIRAGDAERLSAWFADNLEVTIFGSTNDASRNQARQIVKNFFASYTPRAFEINHTAGRPNMKYAFGTLTAGGEKLSVTIFVSCKDGENYLIQQLKIERRN